MQSRVSRGDTQGQENAGHFGPGLKAVRPHLLFSSLKAAAPSVLNCCVILPGQFSDIPHLKSEMWGTRVCGSLSHISKTRCGAPGFVGRYPTSQKRDVGHPGLWVAIPHLKGEMWGTRLCGSLSHISKARCGAPGFVSYPGSYAVWRVRRRGSRVDRVLRAWR